MYHEASFQVGARDTDPFNQCRPSSMMDFLQEAATGAAVELHVSREEMLRNYNVFWMLARIWYRLDTPVFWDDRLTVQTWHRGSGHGASIYRDFDIFRDGRLIGEGVSLWVLADAETRKLRRVSELPEFSETSGGDRCKSRMLPKLRMPVPLEAAEERLRRERPRQQRPLRRLCLRRHRAGGGWPGTFRLPGPDRLPEGVPGGRDHPPVCGPSGRYLLCSGGRRRGKAQIRCGFDSVPS